jgi:hypothetical protein
MPQMKSIYSSHIDEIGYDAETRRLFVRFKTGRVGVYAGVSAVTAAEVMSAPSIGQALHSSVRGEHEFTYLKADDDGGC